MPIRTLPLPTAFGTLPKIREGRINRCSFSIGILLLRSLVHFVKFYYAKGIPLGQPQAMHNGQCTMVNKRSFLSVAKARYSHPKGDILLFIGKFSYEKYKKLSSFCEILLQPCGFGQRQSPPSPLPKRREGYSLRRETKPSAKTLKFTTTERVWEDIQKQSRSLGTG
jgi:hypothetical protein